MATFIRINNRVVNADAIAYVDFLDSGRAMVFMQGLTQEKQNIPVDPEETRRLRAFFDAQIGPDPAPSLPLPGSGFLRH